MAAGDNYEYAFYMHILMHHCVYTHLKCIKIKNVLYIYSHILFVLMKPKVREFQTMVCKGACIKVGYNSSILN